MTPQPLVSFGFRKSGVPKVIDVLGVNNNVPGFAGGGAGVTVKVFPAQALQSPIPAAKQQEKGMPAAVQSKLLAPVAVAGFTAKTPGSGCAQTTSGVKKLSPHAGTCKIELIVSASAGADDVFVRSKYTVTPVAPTNKSSG
jgi:hypothetical protein